MNRNAPALEREGRRESLEGPRRSPVPARSSPAAALSAAALALGSWALTSGPLEPAKPAVAPAPALPRAAALPAPAPDPLLSFSGSDRAPAASEDGLVSWLLKESCPVEAASLPLPAELGPESAIADRRLPEHVERRLLRRYSFEKGLAEAPKAYVPPPEEAPRPKLRIASHLSLRAARGRPARDSDLGGRMATGAVLRGLAAYEKALPVAQGASAASRAWFGGTDDREEALEESGPELFEEDILALNPGKPICRIGGRACRMPDGTFFALESVAQYQKLVEQGLVVFPSPLVFDLDGDGARTTDRKVRFDISGDGIVDEMHDVSSKDAVLVFDADGDGHSGEHARELFGTETDLTGDGLTDGFSNGFDALRAFVERARRDGVLASAPREDGWLEEGDVAALERRYGLRARVGSLRAESVPLREAGIARIRLSGAKPRRIRDFDRQKNDLMRQEGALFTKTDGSTAVYEDLWFRALTPRTLARRGKEETDPRQLVATNFGNR